MPFLTYDEIKFEKINFSNFLNTGISQLDKAIIGFQKGGLNIVSGTTGGGKTSFINNLILNFAQKGHAGLVCSFEIANQRTKRWLNLSALGKNNLKAETNSTGTTYYVPKNEFVEQKCSDWLKKYVYMYDNSTFNYGKVMKEISDMFEKHPNIDYIILDNLMMLDVENGAYTNEWAMQAKMVKHLQVFAQQHNKVVILVVHPTKIKSLPREEDISGSSNIIRIADNILILHRVTTDFKTRAKEYFGWTDEHIMFKYDSIVEITKDREAIGGSAKGMMIGLYFEQCSKRFLNHIGENKQYNWDKVAEQQNIDDLPI